jgi:hypothetical protein
MTKVMLDETLELKQAQLLLKVFWDSKTPNPFATSVQLEKFST